MNIENNISKSVIALNKINKIEQEQYMDLSNNKNYRYKSNKYFFKNVTGNEINNFTLSFKAIKDTNFQIVLNLNSNSNYNFKMFNNNNIVFNTESSGTNVYIINIKSNLSNLLSFVVSNITFISFEIELCGNYILNEVFNNYYIFKNSSNYDLFLKNINNQFLYFQSNNLINLFNLTNSIYTYNKIFDINYLYSSDLSTIKGEIVILEKYNNGIKVNIGINNNSYNYNPIDTIIEDACVLPCLNNGHILQIVYLVNNNLYSVYLNTDYSFSINSILLTKIKGKIKKLNSIIFENSSKYFYGFSIIDENNNAFIINSLNYYTYGVTDFIFNTFPIKIGVSNSIKIVTYGNKLYVYKIFENSLLKAVYRYTSNQNKLTITKESENEINNITFSTRIENDEVLIFNNNIWINHDE